MFSSIPAYLLFTYFLLNRKQHKFYSIQEHQAKDQVYPHLQGVDQRFPVHLPQLQQQRQQHVQLNSDNTNKLNVPA